jgi:outer membrane protein insertion porin family
MPPSVATQSVPKRRTSLAARLLSLCVMCALPSAIARAQDAPIVTAVRVELDGQPVTDPAILALIETTPGKPLSVRDLKESLQHLDGLNRFELPEAYQETVANGVVIIYRLSPLHPVDRVEFAGNLGISEGDLRRAVRERYGEAPPASRVAQVKEFILQEYRDRGYPAAKVDYQIQERENPSRATVVFTAESGPRAVIKEVQFPGEDELPPGRFIARPDIRIGRPYDREEVERALERYLRAMRSNRYYEASASLNPPVFEPDGVIVRVQLRRGRQVRVVFTGDELSRSEQERLVPVESEGSVDETLLEDWERAIENHLHEQGYLDAAVERTNSPLGEPELTITFAVKRGPRFVVGDIVFEGNEDKTDADLLAELRLKTGESFVRDLLNAGINRAINSYRERGFTTVRIDAVPDPIPSERPSNPTRRVQIRVTVVEGPRLTVRSLAFNGNKVATEQQLRDLMTITEGSPFSPSRVTASLDQIVLYYRDRGYESVGVRPLFSFSQDPSADGADIVVSITEGPQTVVDRIIIEGNERTSRETIERELTIRPGQPLGFSDVLESQTRLSALGLFRRVPPFAVRRHPGENRADVIVNVQEALPTTIGFGGGLEVSSVLRANEDGTADERLDYVPRAFFEIGRRNMWGKNRQVNLFTRVSARSSDTRSDTGAIDSSYNINEYRVFGTFREPRAFGTPYTVLSTVIAERARRTSYSFETQEARVEMGGRASPTVSGSVRFSIENTRLYDVNPNLSVEDRPLIDRVFPQVRLSKFSGAVIHNTRDSELDPSRGIFVSADADLAARRIGSEVGYVKTLLQGTWYRQLPSARRMVVALRGILGAAHGFPREAPLLDADGQPVLDPDGAPVLQTVQDLPASERFFAGGSTSNRGFTNDRLGTEETISPAGFPTGGNGEILLNTELRVNLFGTFGGVVFMDAGNVFKTASHMSLSDLRPAAGFGVHYRVFDLPLRAEVGFNLDRRELTPGRLERGSVLHVSIGPAF